MSKETKKAQYHRRKDAGVCVYCGKAPAVPQRTRCEGCAQKQVAHHHTPTGKHKYAEYHKEYYRRVKPRVQAQSYAYTLRRRGLTPAEYDTLLQGQGGACAVCGGINPHGVRLAVDHCHETDRVRGLLCFACNTGIGKLGDTAEGLMRAVAYLQGGPA